MQEWANEGVVDVLLETHCRLEIGELATQNGVGDYRVDSDVLAVKDIDPVGGLDIELVSLDQILDARRASNVPGSAIWLSIQGDLFSIYPTPSAAQTIKYYYVHRPTPMTLDSHDPSLEAYGGIPEEFHRAIRAYMNWQAAMYDEKQAPMPADQYLALYQNELRNVRKRVRHKAQRGLNPGRVGYPGRGIPRRNDQYPER